MVRSFCSLFSIIQAPAKPIYAVFRCVALSVFILLSACNSTPQSTIILPGTSSTYVILPAPVPLPAGDSERLHIACDAWYTTILKSRGFNGGIVVAKKGTIVFEAYNGNGNPRGTDPITDSTPFHIASVSKTFTAMAVLRLWQEEKLSIDDEFSKYFPNFNYPGVTIRSLLNHRSGLPNYVHFMENMGWNKKVYVTNQDVLDFLITRKAQMTDIGTADRRFMYCNTNFALLALLIEKLSGKKYGDYLQETFFSPLGMKHTFVYNETDSGKVTMSYDYRGKLIPLNFLDMVYGDKNVYSTPRDLLTWDRALTSGMLFTEKTLTEAYAPYSNEKRGVRNYGLGWRMNIYSWGKKMIYHNGWWHGNNAAFIRLIEDSATIVVLGNKYDRGIYHARDLANLFGNYSGDGEEEESEAAKTTDLATKNLPPVIKQRGHQNKRSVARKINPQKAIVKKKAGQPTKKKRH